MDRQQEFVLRTLEERDIRFVRLWFTDVLGAWALALAWLTVVVTAHRLYVRAGRAGRRPGRPRGDRSHTVDPV